jgi:hypothetical protein
MKSFAILLAGFMAFATLARPAHAQTQGVDVSVTVLGRTTAVTGSSSEHFLTFSAPIGIPGVGLAPGTYIFRFIAPSVMQVLSEDRSTAYAAFFVVPTSRSEITSEYAVVLRRVRSDAPARIATMFAPDASTGYELIYPNMEIAVESRQVAMK